MGCLYLLNEGPICFWAWYSVVKDMNGSEVFRFAINYDLRKIQGIYYKR